ncbi:M48 family metallopeptidase [Thiohalomonas denitrificans]|uniref:Peptidase family M48 n=1 Tax=Thiohalomonas denitrificans TaxID=415747 RepID=A0A1G5QJ83_9GAMM|nr:M48 family metallopeptidase [Thiohalomonas denitrificans]SCZ61229.1 Peptidase family M48 [Thiohalomonas denitrificans]
MRTITVIVVSFLVVACTTSPLGRQQLILLPEAQMTEMGATAFQEIQREKPTAGPGPTTNYVQCVAEAITRQLPPSAPQQWQLSVFEDEEPNAFALPGGNMGVNTGILDIAQNPSQLATVVAHEIAHVLADHPNERVSTQYATQTGLDLLQAITGAGGERQQLFALLGMGAQVGVILPFSRKQEQEADLFGLDLMARAGFDPRESTKFWQRMETRGNGSPPEFLSTHPSGETRMSDLQARIPAAMEIYRQARAQGVRPDCQPPGR